MLIYRCCRLRAAVAIRDVEIEGSDVVLAEGAFECGARSPATALRNWVPFFSCPSPIDTLIHFLRVFSDA
jgi:hypothetical protein